MVKQQQEGSKPIEKDDTWTFANIQRHRLEKPEGPKNRLHLQTWLKDRVQIYSDKFAWERCVWGGCSSCGYRGEQVCS